MNVTIIGGGNIGTLIAAELAKKNHKVTIYTSKPEMWHHEITVYNGSTEEEPLFTSRISKFTNDIEEALKDAEMVWITHPSFEFSKLNDLMKPFVKKGMIVVVVPGSGGAEFSFSDLIKCGAVLFGLQRVHSIARLEEYGKSVHMLGRKSRLYGAAIPYDMTNKICELIADMFDMPCVPLKNYLSVTMTPSNPILHTSRLYIMFKNYREGYYYNGNILFYEEWTLESSEMLIACDDELQKVCEKSGLDLKDVKSLKVHYESDTAEKMTDKISSIKAFEGLKSPMIQKDGGWIPDFSSRYFTADFSYGLKILVDIADLYNVDVPNMKKSWNWYLETAKPHNYFSLSEYIKTVEEFEGLYS